MAAGDAEAVRYFCQAFQAAVADLGLQVSVDKCEVVPAAGAASAVPPEWFAGWQWKPAGGVKLLGAPFGEQDFCANFTSKRAAKAEALLKEVGAYGHTQGALQLLRHCAGWGKLVYSSRTVPPHWHHRELASFGVALRGCLEQMVGEKLSDRSWSLAQLGIVHGGLGIRDPAKHAAAAYLASLSQTRELCGLIDPSFDGDDADGGLYLHATEADLRASVLEAAAPDRGGSRLTQKEVSSLVDAALLQQLAHDQRHDAFFCAHLALNALPGAGVWLTAPPVKDDREIDAPLFKVEVLRRIRMPVFEEDDFCPLCGQVSDKWGDHALVCQCCGDRTIRHNALRNVCFEEATDGGIRPEREKAGLLPGRPGTDGLPDAPLRNLRRPADVWLPKGVNGGGEALDFAVTSGMRSDRFREAATSPEAAFQRYEKLKREYKQTEQSCSSAGFRFVHMVLEAHAGGWGPSARVVLDWLAQQVAAAQHIEPHAASLKIAQRLSCVLHRENARAVLRRKRAVEASCPLPSGWDSPAEGWQ